MNAKFLSPSKFFLDCHGEFHVRFDLSGLDKTASMASSAFSGACGAPLVRKNCKRSIRENICSLIVLSKDPSSNRTANCASKDSKLISPFKIRWSSNRLTSQS